MNRKKFTLVLLLTVLLADSLRAQIAVTAQIRTRSEYRDGQGTPSPHGTPPAFFTSQRTRLSAIFSGHRFTICTSLQDVRVWGQDGSSINRITVDSYDGLLLHEAWAELVLPDTGSLVKNLTLKIGRQELVYDDVRLLGNLDWLQQGRRHDAALLKLDQKNWKAHAGVAFNQSGERKSGTVYAGTPAGYAAGTNNAGALYKSMQFLYVATKLSFGNASFLAFKDDFSKFSFAPADSLKANPVYGNRAWSRLTTGFNLSGTIRKKVTSALSAFYQGGKYRDGTELNEYLLSASFLVAATSRVSVGPGIDITSGNNGADPSGKYQRFDPLYGTPHKFWGYMDYFYAADGFGPGGLVDYYVKSKLKAGDNIQVNLDLHRFVLPEAVANETGDAMQKALGTETDLVINWSVTKVINIEGGFSAMFSTPTMASPKVKNVAGAQDLSTWAYGMVSIKPELFSTSNKSK